VPEFLDRDALDRAMTAIVAGGCHREMPWTVRAARTLDVRSVVRLPDTVLIACSLTVATLHRTEFSRKRERERASRDQSGWKYARK